MNNHFDVEVVNGVVLDDTEVVDEARLVNITNVVEVDEHLRNSDFKWRVFKARRQQKFSAGEYVFGLLCRLKR